jgi:hypothetical protein
MDRYLTLRWGQGSVLRFFGRVRGYIRENWGAPFILGFMGSLLVAVVLLILGFPWMAEAVGNVAYFSLVAGVVLQLVCFWRRGSDGRSENEGGAGN